MATKKISVIIPVYNSSDFIDRCLTSVVSQSYSNLEIIIINDGSTDTTLAICEGYTRRDSRFKIIHQENKGVSEARNAGLKIATGDYLAFIDNDDFIHPDFFSILLKALESGDYDMVSSCFRPMWENSISMHFSEIKDFEEKIWFKEDWFEGLLGIPIDKYRNTHIPYEMIWGKLYKRNLLDNLYFENLWGEDSEFNSKVYSRLNKSILINVPLYIWVQRNTSAHRSDPHYNIESFLDSTLKTYENIPFELTPQKAKALQRVWLTILSIRYIILSSSQYEIKKNNIPKIKEIASSFQTSFLKNPYIPFGFKVGIMIFYHFPFTYKLFRKGMDFYTRKKKLKTTLF